MTRNAAFCLTAFLCVVCALAQNKLPAGLSPELSPPSLNAKLTIGFNYDLLRPPTDVSFDYAKGYLAMNFPLQQNNFISKATAKQLWDTISGQLSQDASSGEQFQPQAGARQFANTTVRVDVPMLGGVASFSNIQNVYISYQNTLGNADLSVKYDTTVGTAGSMQNVALFLRGAVNVPVDATVGWETMTFGYAYRVNKNLVVAADVHRHIFRLDLLAKVDVDMLGRYSVVPQNSGGSGVGAFGGGSIELRDQPIDYSSQQVFGEADGHFEAQAWSASFGVKYWRFTLTSRFGIDTKAQGSLVARYHLPFFIDKRTFKAGLDITDPQKLASSDVLNKLQQNSTDSVVYSTNEDATFKLPQGHTIAFDILRDRLTLSYTKLFGDIEAYHAYRPNDSDDPAARVVDLDAAITVDHIIMLSGNFYSGFFNVGVFGLDIRVGDESHLLGKAIDRQTSAKWLKSMKLGELPMFPILNLGATLGMKTQLGFEIDLLPLPAFKTGVVYHF